MRLIDADDFSGAMKQCAKFKTCKDVSGNPYEWQNKCPCEEFETDSNLCGVSYDLYGVTLCKDLCCPCPVKYCGKQECALIQINKIVKALSKSVMNSDEVIE